MFQQLKNYLSIFLANKEQLNRKMCSLDQYNLHFSLDFLETMEKIAEKEVAFSEKSKSQVKKEKEKLAKVRLERLNAQT